MTTMRIETFDCDGPMPFRAAVDGDGVAHFALRFEVARPRRRRRAGRQPVLLAAGAFWIIANAAGVIIMRARLRTREETEVFGAAAEEAFLAHQRLVFGLPALGDGDYPPELLADLGPALEVLTEVEGAEPEDFEDYD